MQTKAQKLLHLTINLRWLEAKAHEQHSRPDMPLACLRRDVKGFPVKPVEQLSRADVVGVGLTGTVTTRPHLCEEHRMHHMMICAEHNPPQRASVITLIGRSSGELSEGRSQRLSTCLAPMRLFQLLTAAQTTHHSMQHRLFPSVCPHTPNSSVS